MIFVLLLFLASIVNAQESHWRDGKIEFVKYYVNNVECWTDQERDKEIQKYNLSSGSFQLVVTDFKPDSFELALASSSLRFENYSDFLRSVQDNAYLTNRLMDAPPSTQASLDYVRSEAEKIRR